MNHPEDAPEAFQAAWNSHDMKALAALFHENAIFVNQVAKRRRYSTRLTPRRRENARRKPSTFA